MSTHSHTSLRQRLLSITMVSTAIAGGLVVPASAIASVGFCRASVPVTISVPDARDSESMVRTPAFGGGSVSCVGNLGSWLMGGQGGWSTVSGTLHTGQIPFDPASGTQYTGGRLRMWAEAPRYAWFHASLVNFTTILHVRPVVGGFTVTGSGRLVPTFKSSTRGSFKVTGVAQLLERHPRARSSRRISELLRLQFSVRNQATR
jgi:hypothetical protein